MQDDHSRGAIAIIIRAVHTKRYLAGYCWMDDSRDAEVFSNTPEAVKECVLRDLESVELVLTRYGVELATFHIGQKSKEVVPHA